MNEKQAATILAILQTLPRGAMVEIIHTPGGKWFAAVSTPQADGVFCDTTEHYGEDLVDALGQACTVISLNQE